VDSVFLLQYSYQGTLINKYRLSTQGDKMKKLILMSLVLILAACSLDRNSELKSNQQKWEDANITHYRFELNIGCFCVFRGNMPLTIEVQNGDVVSMVASDGTSISQADPNYEYYSRYMTIERLFSELGAGLASKADEVTVTYDPNYGFPTEINIDFIKNAVDDELYLSVSGFEVLH
jgi:hypothetical protein